MRDDDAPGRQHVLDHAQTQREAKIQPYRVRDDLGGKAVTMIERITGTFWHGSSSQIFISRQLTLRCRVGYSPPAKTTNVRTREHLRRWGIADQLRAASPIAPDYPSTVVFATRMNGPQLARFDNVMNGSLLRNDLYSEEAQWVPQYVLEEVLRKHASSLPTVSIRFSTELVSFSDEGDCVVSEPRMLDSGKTETVFSCYLIGADGARSGVRDAIGARMQGDGGYSSNYSIIFRAPDLATCHDHGKAIMHWMVNNAVPSLLGPMDHDGLWFFMATRLANGIDPETVDPIALIR